MKLVTADKYNKKEADKKKREVETAPEHETHLATFTVGWVRPSKSGKTLKVTTFNGKIIGYIPTRSLNRLYYGSIAAAPLVLYKEVK